MPGQIVHIEIPADDTEQGREFWGSLFGWQFQAYPGPSEYHMTRIDGHRPPGDELAVELRGRQVARARSRAAADDDEREEGDCRPADHPLSICTPTRFPHSVHDPS